jgi:hypothetical protein
MYEIKTMPEKEEDKIHNLSFAIISFFLTKYNTVTATKSRI